ncbi:MAG TPA: PH domain-containing protein [Candidatus Paceibacterota bacterium]
MSRTTTNLPLEPGENIVLICRKHWIVYTLNGFALFLMFLLPYGIYRLLNLSSVLELTGKYYYLAMFFYVAWFLLLWTYFFITWTNIYLDEWIITDKRIIDIEQQSLFHRSVSDFRIENIQNITVREQGFVANMLGYGSIHVETAGEKENLSFETLPRPYKVRDMITECHDKCLARLENSGISHAVHNLITES